MVVGHDDVDAGGARRGDLLDSRDRAVDRDEQRGAARGEPLDGREREPVAVVDPARQVPVDVGAERAQRAHQHGGGADAVDVVVAVHRDARAACDVGEDPRCAFAQAAERVERVAHVGVEERARRRRIAEPAPDQHLRRDVRDAQRRAQPLGGGVVVGRDLQADVGNGDTRATVRAGQDGTAAGAVARRARRPALVSSGSLPCWRRRSRRPRCRAGRPGSPRAPSRGRCRPGPGRRSRGSRARRAASPAARRGTRRRCRPRSGRAGRS